MAGKREREREGEHADARTEQGERKVVEGRVASESEDG